jgi:iron complex outermembrane receptor protein
MLYVTMFSSFLLIAQDSSSAVDRDTLYYLSPIIVNPTQAHERETPATFSNLTKQQLSERYSVQDVPVLLSELPSVTTYSENGNGIGYNYITLRGFDQRRLSVMINGVPQNDPEDHNVYWIDFPDLLASTSAIQVQRGAGSAFYGPPAIGGSVNIVTNPFGSTPGVTVESMFGFQEFGDSNVSFHPTTKKIDVSINSGLINKQYLLYGRLGKIVSDGYRANSWSELNSYFLGAVRLDDAVTTHLHIYGGPLTDGLAYTGLPKFTGQDVKLRRSNWGDWNSDSTMVNYSPLMRRVVANDGRDTIYVVPRRRVETESFAQPHYEMMNEWRISPSLTLNNTLFYYTGEGYFDYDASWADTSLLRLGTQYGIPTTQNPTNALVRAFVGNSQWGWLPHIEIEHNNGTLTLGSEIRFHHSTHWGKIQFAEGLPTHFDPEYHFYEYNGVKDILSFYLHELYRPNQQTTVLADLQLVHNRYSIINEKYLGNTFNFPYLFINPRAGINYNIDDRWNTYASFGYTSREPRLANLYSAEESYYGATPQFAVDTSGGNITYDFNKPIAKPERLLDIECGVSMRSASTQLSANVFWMEFTDELVKNGQVDIFGQPVTSNAERSRHIGVEIDGTVSVNETFSVSGNLSLSRNRLVRYTIIENGSPVTLDDNPIAGFPDVLSNVRFTYRNDVLTASLLTKYVGAFYTDNFKNENNKNDAYTVANAELLYRLPRIIGSQFTIRAEVRNLFNRLYFMSGEGDAFFPAAERNYLIGLTANM